VLPTAPRTPLLFDAYPSLARALPFVTLCDAPTPVEPCAAIASYLGRREGVSMKRDDRISSLYGGNKVRRYELVLGDALARGARRLVTVGGIASTQVMATVLFGKALGLGVRAVLFDQPLTTFARMQVAGYAKGGAELVYGGGYAGTAYRAVRTMAGTSGNYFIFPGASGPLANVGYVDAMLELGRQVERGEAERPDVIVLPTGSSGTLAALALGAAMLGWKTEVVGVRITSRLVANHVTIDRLVRATSRFLRARAPSFPDCAHRVSYSLYHGAIGEGYGYPTPEAIEGCDVLEALTGTHGEVTYSGKAIAGLRALLALPRYAKKSFLLWNTLSAKVPDHDGGQALVPSSLAWMWTRPTVA
jgi:D-cysteine desulfhydrase